MPEACFQHDDVEEAGLAAGPDDVARDADGDVALARADAADEHDVVPEARFATTRCAARKAPPLS